MPPKLATPPVSGRTTPIATETLSRPTTPAKVATPTTARTQEAPADATMPLSRTPSRTASNASNGNRPSRTGTPLPTPAIVKRDSLPIEAAKSGEASGSSPADTSVATPEMEKQVAGARAEMSLKRRPSLEVMLADPEVAAQLGQEERDVISTMDHFIATGETPPPASTTSRPGSELAQALHQEASGFMHGAKAYGNSAMAGCARTGATIAGLMKRVAANEDFGFKGTVAASVANVAALNLVKVWGPTLARQYISYGIEAGLEATNAGTTARAVIGSIPAVTSAALELAGAIRDHRAGTATTVSQTSRAVMGGLALGGAGAALGTGAMAGVAALTPAFQLYCAMRDLGPGVAIKAVDKNALAKGFAHWLMHTIQYGINQAGVNHAMTKLASPSGAGAFTAGAGLQHGNNAKRATFNEIGETIDDLASPMLDMVLSMMDKDKETKPMQISLQNVGYSKENFLNAVTLWATRTSATSQGLTGGGTAGKLIANPEVALGMTDAVLAVVNGPEYFHFANTLSGQPAGTDRRAARQDVETGLTQPVGRDAPIELTQSHHSDEAQPSTSA